MIGKIWTTIAISQIVVGTVGILVARRDIDRELQAWNYSVLQDARVFGDKELISPTMHQSSEVVAGLPSESDYRERSKLISAKLGYAPIAVACYSAILLAAGLFLSAVPLAWPLWRWLLSPAFGNSRRVRIADRLALALFAVLFTSLIVCSSFDPAGLINIAISPVDQHYDWEAWEAGWTSGSTQMVRTVGHWCKQLLVVALTIHFTFLFCVRLQSQELHS